MNTKGQVLDSDNKQNKDQRKWTEIDQIILYFKMNTNVYQRTIHFYYLT